MQARGRRPTTGAGVERHRCRRRRPALWRRRDAGPTGGPDRPSAHRLLRGRRRRAAVATTPPRGGHDGAATAATAGDRSASIDLLNRDLKPPRSMPVHPAARTDGGGARRQTERPPGYPDRVLICGSRHRVRARAHPARASRQPARRQLTAVGLRGRHGPLRHRGHRERRGHRGDAAAAALRRRLRPAADNAPAQPGGARDARGHGRGRLERLRGRGQRRPGRPVWELSLAFVGFYDRRPRRPPSPTCSCR